jgi:hypothetical protein
MKHLFTLIFPLLLLSALSSAQSIGPSELNATGKSVVTGGNTYEYAIGAVVGLGAYQSSSLVVTPGVLQPQNAQPNGIDENAIPGSSLSVYPNPVQETLFLQPAFGKKGMLKYILLDGAGRTLMTRNATLEHGNELQEIQMSAYAIGQYTLSVEWQQQGKAFNTAYKIQKIK